MLPFLLTVTPSKKQSLTRDLLRKAKLASSIIVIFLRRTISQSVFENYYFIQRLRNWSNIYLKIKILSSSLSFAKRKCIF